MATDFRSQRIRTNALIVSRSDAGNASFIIYSGSNATNSVGGISDSNMLGKVGKDVFLFVSGTKTDESTGARRGGINTAVTLFGGDIVVSGTLYAERQVIEVDEEITGSLSLSGSLYISQSATINETLTVGNPFNSRMAAPTILLKETDTADGPRVMFVNNSDATGPTGDSHEWTLYGKSAAQGKPGEAKFNLWYGDAEPDSPGTGRNLIHVKGSGSISLGRGAQTLLNNASDAFLYVSGAKNSAGTKVAGTSIFGGDVHVSGAINVAGAAAFDTLWLTGTRTDAGQPPDIGDGSGWQGVSLRLANGIGFDDGDSWIYEKSDDLAVVGKHNLFLSAAEGAAYLVSSGGNVNIGARGDTADIYISASDNITIEAGDNSGLYGGENVYIGAGTNTQGQTYIKPSNLGTGAWYYGGTDVGLSISGSVCQSDTPNTYGAVTIGGDLVVSGGLQVGGENWHLLSDGSGGTISGSIHHTTGGLSYLVAGDNITVASSSNGQITITSLGGGGGSGVDWQSTTDGKLVATGSATLAGTKGYSFDGTSQGTDIFFYVSGAIDKQGVTPAGWAAGTSVFGGDLVVSGGLDVEYFANFNRDVVVLGSASFGGGLSGSLTQLSTGLSYIVQGSGITITSSSNGQVRITANNSGDITGVTAGTGLSGGGSGPGSVTLNLDVNQLSTTAVADAGDYLVIEDGNSGVTEKVLLSNLPFSGAPAGQEGWLQIRDAAGLLSGSGGLWWGGSEISNHQDRGLHVSGTIHVAPGTFGTGIQFDNTAGTVPSIYGNASALYVDGDDYLLLMSDFYTRNDRGFWSNSDAASAAGSFTIETGTTVDDGRPRRLGFGLDAAANQMVLLGGTENAISTNQDPANFMYTDYKAGNTGTPMPDDIGVFISGSILGKGTTGGGIAGWRGTTVVGGDQVISGALYLENLMATVSTTPTSVPGGSVAIYGKTSGAETKLFMKYGNTESEVGAGASTMHTGSAGSQQFSADGQSVFCSDPATMLTDASNPSTTGHAAGVLVIFGQDLGETANTVICRTVLPDGATGDTYIKLVTSLGSSIQGTVQYFTFAYCARLISPDGQVVSNKHLSNPGCWTDQAQANFGNNLAAGWFPWTAQVNTGYFQQEILNPATDTFTKYGTAGVKIKNLVSSGENYADLVGGAVIDIAITRKEDAVSNGLQAGSMFMSWVEVVYYD